jgi:hypothetical protein
MIKSAQELKNSLVPASGASAIIPSCQIQYDSYAIFDCAETAGGEIKARTIVGVCVIIGSSS